MPTLAGLFKGVPLEQTGSESLPDAQAIVAALTLGVACDEVVTVSEKEAVLAELERRFGIRLLPAHFDSLVERIAGSSRRRVLLGLQAGCRSWAPERARRLLEALVHTLSVDEHLSEVERRFLGALAEAIGVDLAALGLGIPSAAARDVETLARVPLAEGTPVRVGRSVSMEIRLPRAPIAACQATLSLAGSELVVQEHGDALLTFEGEPVAGSLRLRPGQEVCVGRYRLRFDASPFRVSVIKHGVATTLEARGVGLSIPFRGGLRPILSGVSFTARAGEMVAVIGPSGCGKSTLLSVLNGTAPASAGQATLDGVRIAPGIEAAVRRISFVPQDDLLLSGLTVEESVSTTGRLKGLGGHETLDLGDMVDEVLAGLGLGSDEVRGSRVGDAVQRGISGGQRKRVSVAQELVGDDTDVLMLDEPTSGLDPRNEANVVAMLREIADGGKLVLISTHAVFSDNLTLFDKVLCLAVGGHFAYYGPPEGMLAHFGVPGLHDVFAKLEAFEPGAAPGAAAEAPAGTPQPVRPAKRPLGLGPQFAVLALRQLRVRLRDRAGIFLALVLPMAVAATLWTIYLPDCVEPSGLFVLGLASVWSGISFTVRDLIADFPVLRHETRTRTSVVAAYAAKVLVATLAATVQSLLLLLALFVPLGAWNVGGFAGWSGSIGEGILFSANLMSPWHVFLVLLASHVLGNALGLLLSSLFKTADAAIFMIPLVLVPFIASAGAIVYPRDLPDSLRPALRLNPLYWSYTGLLAASANTCQPFVNTLRAGLDWKGKLDQRLSFCEDAKWRTVSPPEGRDPGSRAEPFVRSVRSCGYNAYFPAGEFYERVGLDRDEPKDAQGNPSGDPVRQLQSRRLRAALTGLLGMALACHAAAVAIARRRLKPRL